MAFLLLIGVALLRTSAAADKGDTILVFPPADRTRNADLAWICEGIALSVSEQIQLPGLRVVSMEARRRFVEAADLPPHAILSRASMMYVARGASADKLVWGQLSGTESSLRLSVRVLDLQSLKSSGEIIAAGPLSALPQIENELAWLILDAAGTAAKPAREEFRKRTRMVPNSAFSLWITGLDVEDGAERLKMLEQATVLAPHFTDAQRALGRLLYEQEDCSRALAPLKLADAGGRATLEDRFFLANCLLRHNELEEALRAYDAILAFVRSAPALNNQALAFLKKGDLILAAQSLVEARSLERSNAAILGNLALVRFLQGDSRTARELLEDWRQGNPPRPQLDSLLARIYLDSGDAQLAAHAAEMAAKLGLDIEKLRSQDPGDWVRLIKNWHLLP